MNNYQQLQKNLHELKLTQISLQIDDYINKINEHKLSIVDALCELTSKEVEVKNFNAAHAMVKVAAFPHLKELKEGKTIEQPVYSYITCSRSADETVTVAPADVIIVEGILIFTCAKLRKQLDIKLFVDADDDDRLMRVMSRDILERGKTVEWVIERYSKTVKPMYLQFIEPSKRYADVIIPQGGHNKVAIDIISATIEKSLSECKKK